MQAVAAVAARYAVGHCVGPGTFLGVSTDFQSAREALGARLNELRTGAGLNGRAFAQLLGWQPSKVSRLQNGRQTATPEDLTAWAAACGRPDTAPDLLGQLRALESRQRHWRKQLAAGHAPVQDRYVVEYRQTTVLRGHEATVIPGLFQTPDYARHLLMGHADLIQTPRDTEAAVASRMRRQEVLHATGKLFRVLVWEGALHALVCPRDVMAGQLDRLVGLIGMSTVEFGIVPLGAPMRLTPKHGFWIFDESRVVVETINTELSFDATDDLDLCPRGGVGVDCSGRGDQVPGAGDDAVGPRCSRHWAHAYRAAREPEFCSTMSTMTAVPEGPLCQWHQPNGAGAPVLDGVVMARTVGAAPRGGLGGCAGLRA